MVCAMLRGLLGEWAEDYVLWRHEFECRYRLAKRQNLDLILGEGW